MSATQGRIPPPMPLPGQPRAMPEGGQQAQHPQQPPQQEWPLAPPQGGQPAPSFPPRFQAPPPQQQYVQPSLGGYPDNGNVPQQQQAWSPAPPAPYPPLPGQAAPQQHGGGLQPPSQGFGYPSPQQPDVRTEPSRRQQDARLPDPSAYDLGSYGLPMAPAMPSPPTGRDVRTAPPQLQPQPQAQMHAPMPGQWPPQQHADNAFGRTPLLQQPAYQPQPQAQNGGYQGGQHPGPQHPGPQSGHHAGGYQAGAAQDHEDDELEVDEPPRRRRRWMIAAALVGSICVGSGLAYAYKLFLGPKMASTDGRGQVVRASQEPVKVAPADRGGKQFANTDSRVLNNRVPSEGNSAASGGDAGSAGTTDSNGVRRVATVPVGPAGAVPGMMVVGPSGGPGLPASMMEPPRTTSQQPPPQQQFQPPAQTQRVAAVQPAPVATPPPAPPRQPVVRAPQPAAEPEAAQKTAAVAPKPPAADRPKPISGYVAVLGFQRSQLEAMKMMADLQQKYDVLRDKRLEIVQSDQTARGLGTIYRVIVGPRGGITPVRDLCNQLQTAGMPKQGCYPLGE